MKQTILNYGTNNSGLESFVVDGYGAKKKKLTKNSILFIKENLEGFTPQHETGKHIINVYFPINENMGGEWKTIFI